jgi:heme/copper-type cytochrome/quinol oxidase subunit 2
MIVAVSLKILIPNYQTARNHTLEHRNLHNVPKIGDIKMWFRDMNGIIMMIIMMIIIMIIVVIIIMIIMMIIMMTNFRLKRG